MKKRILQVLTVLSVAVFGLTGCGGSKAKETIAETGAIPYERGTTTETGWESQWADMRFIAGEGITMMSQENMDKVMDIGTEELGTDKDDIEGTYTYEMMASDAGGTSSVSVVVEKSELTAEKYLEQLLSNLKDTDIEFVTDDKIAEAEVGGHTYKMIKVSSEYQGFNMVQEYYIREQGGYLIKIITVSMADNTETVESMLDSLNKFE